MLSGVHNPQKWGFLQGQNFAHRVISLLLWLKKCGMTVNYSGIAIGLATFLIIGLFHPVVIKAEYHFGVRCWWVFLLVGIAGAVASLCIQSFLVSTLVGVVAFSSLWSIKEVFEQRKRVQRGWFPKNPKRKGRTPPEQPQHKPTGSW